MRARFRVTAYSQPTGSGGVAPAGQLQERFLDGVFGRGGPLPGVERQPRGVVVEQPAEEFGPIMVLVPVATNHFRKS